MADDKNQSRNVEQEARSKIARHIVYWALASLTLLGLVGIGCAYKFEGDQAKLSGVKDIISMILPVVAAWVGTVLAFYFSRENFLAAAENNAAVLNLKFDQRLQTIAAADVMLPIEKADVLTSDAGEDQIKLKDDLIKGKFNDAGRNRLPILNSKGAVRYVVHRSIVDKFVAEKVLIQNEPQAANLTLRGLVDDQEYKAWIVSFRTVDRTAKLSDVKLLMDRDPKCADVFVTADGKTQSRTLGWITNAMVLEKLKA